MIKPLTIVECDEQLLLTHARYLRADRQRDFEAAAVFYAELNELLEIRARLPQQRPASA